MQEISTRSQEIELLYQRSPRIGSPKNHKHFKGWTCSLESYQKEARRKYNLFLANHRQANHEIVIGYQQGFPIQMLLDQLTLIIEYLRKHEIIAYYVVEITTRQHILPNGECKDYPINIIHYHFLIDSHYSKHRIRNIFKGACQHAGLKDSDYKVKYYPIPDRKEFERKIKYILKFGNYASQAILFRPHTGIKKAGDVNVNSRTRSWFINADGTRMNQEKKWKAIVAGWYPSQQQKPVKITIRFTISIPVAILAALIILILQKNKSIVR